MAFELVRKKDAPKIPAQSIRPRLKSCALDIALYGLRDLIMSKTAGERGELGLELNGSWDCNTI